MTRVYLGVGSNIERERYIVAGLDALQGLLGDLELSSVYDSAAIGFEGQAFLNLVVGIDTDWAVGELARRLRHIETEHGRPAKALPNSSRQLDIDILTYGNLAGVVDGVSLPREEILFNAFVLCPLAELAPMELHPMERKSYQALWSAYGNVQALRRVAFEWRGRKISEDEGLCETRAVGVSTP